MTVSRHVEAAAEKLKEAVRHITESGKAPTTFRTSGSGLKRSGPIVRL